MTATDTQRDTAVALVRGGMPRAHAAKLVGVTHTTVGRWVEEEGVDLCSTRSAARPRSGTPPGLAALTTYAVLRRLSRVASVRSRSLPGRRRSGVNTLGQSTPSSPPRISSLLSPGAGRSTTSRRSCAEVIHGAVKGAGADDPRRARDVRSSTQRRCGRVRRPTTSYRQPAPSPGSPGPARAGRAGAGRHPALRPLLRRGGLLAFLAPSSYGQAINHQPAMREWSPAYQPG